MTSGPVGEENDTGRGQLIMTTTVTTAATRPRLTLEQFEARRDTKPASEFVCGEIFRKSMPNPMHAVIQNIVSFLLRRFIMRAGRGEVGSEWRCTFGPPGDIRSYVPDLVYITEERVPADLGEPFRAAPDLAVEILSPNDRPGRLLRKVLFYLRHGVRMVWVIDPKRRSVTVYTPDADERELVAGDTLDGGDVLPGFRVPVTDLFPRERVATR